jgi:hypothetical protein
MRAWEFDEASYEGNVGVIELVKFFQTASPELISQVKDLVAQGADKQVWQIVQKHTGTNLVGDEFNEALAEVLKRIDGKWALVSKKDPKKVLQYYRGPKDKKPSDEWVRNVERRVHAFEDDTENTYKPEWPFNKNYNSKGEKEHKLLDKPTPTVGQLADMHNVDIKHIMKQLVKGIKVELEHTSDPKIAKEIALDHIAEKPDYYDRLEDVEENFADGKVKGKSIYESLTMPKFDVEWDEAARYPEFEKIGKEAWIKLAKKGKAVTIKSAKDINNTDAADPNSFKSLDKNKQARALAQLKSGNVEMPIVAVYSDGYKELVGGNTRLTAMMAQNGKATVWQFAVPDEVAELAENFADGKVKGKSRPGRVKRAGASCKGSVSDLRAKAKKYSGERGKMYHWCANMKSGKKK